MMRKVIAGILLALAVSTGAVVMASSPAQADLCRQWDGTWRDC